MSELRKIKVRHREVGPDRYQGRIMRKIHELNDLRSLMRSYRVMGYNTDREEHYGNLSARVGKRSVKFVCTATQTSGLDKLGKKHYPVVEDFQEGEICSMGLEAKIEPSVEASTHDGFYRGNARIMYIAHGHNSHIYYAYGTRHQESISLPQAVILPQSIRYGTLRIRQHALASAKKILQHASPDGKWGLMIPKGHFDAFFLVGESAKAVAYGFLYCLQSSNNFISSQIMEDLLSRFEDFRYL